MSIETTFQLRQSAEQVAELLSQQQVRIVFAESCTAGLVSATLAQVPGISAWHCGSAVTYREATKAAWLAISPETFERHNVVSAEVARQMAAGVLQITPEADIAAAITGHLGPDAPEDLDGIVYIAVARREAGQVTIVDLEKHQLTAATRPQRQQQAALTVLRMVVDLLQQD